MIIVRRIKLYSICILIGLGFFLIYAGFKYITNTTYPLRLPDRYSLRSNVIFTNKARKKEEECIPTNQDGSPNFEKIYEITRNKIKHDLAHYNLSYSGVQKIDDLLIESGGNPVRNIIISAWRSGSTFLGDLLNAMPSNFYFFEPLLRYNVNQIRGPPHARNVIRSLKTMLRCEFKDMEDFFEFAKYDMPKAHEKYWRNQFELNTRLWNYCKHNNELCLNANFTADFCKLFPFQNMKVVRLRLHLVNDILEDKKLAVKVVFLVRDPRGMLESRRHRRWCVKSPDCIRPDIVCSDMVSDYKAARRLLQKHHGRVMVLRFEDFALNLDEKIPELLKFLRLGPTQSMKEFIDEHTNSYSNKVFSTVRITQNVPFKWKQVLDFEYVHKIQEACKEAMDLWGYKPAHNASHMKSKSFYPLETFSVM